jgi:hypothetical protein
MRERKSTNVGTSAPVQPLVDGAETELSRMYTPEDKRNGND